MSQAGVASNKTSPASDVEFITGNSGGAVGPDAAFNLNLLGAEEVIVTGSPATNTLTIDSINGSANTVGAVTADLITLPLGAVPAGYSFYVIISGFDITTPSIATYSITGGIRTTGAAAVRDATPSYSDSEAAPMIPTDDDLIAVGNNAVVRVTGVAGLTIHWKAKIIYTKAT
jgi:hypothetical protein